MDQTIAAIEALRDQLAELEKLRLQKERKKAYLREFMRKKWANDADYRLYHKARKHGLTPEEYLQKKESGEIHVGRPRKDREQIYLAQNARRHNLTIEEYLEKKESGEIRRGRPCKTAAA